MIFRLFVVPIAGKSDIPSFGNSNRSNASFGVGHCAYFLRL